MTRGGPKVYRQIGEEMQKGLKNIYHQITATATAEGSDRQNPKALFTEASSQVAELVKATQAAAMNIMDLVEEQAKNAEAAGEIIRELKKEGPQSARLAELEEYNASLVTALEQVLTALSFQDITGQRLRKVTDALKHIESSVLELYLASGLALEVAAQQENGDAEAVNEEAWQMVENFRETGHVKSQLKGPDNNAMSQESIDRLLAELGNK